MDGGGEKVEKREMENGHFLFREDRDRFSFICCWFFVLDSERKLMVLRRCAFLNFFFIFRALGRNTEPKVLCGIF